MEAEVPGAVRNREDGEAPPMNRLPRFWDQVGVLYRRGDQDDLAADPFLASGSVPSMSGTFRERGIAETTLPEFNPSACTACCECWTHCPDAAIGAAVMTPDELLKKAMAVARESGRSADALRRIVSKLARSFAGNLEGKNASSNVGGALSSAFNTLMDKTPPAGDQKGALDEAMRTLVELAGDLPVATADPLGNSLLGLSIDPDRCKGCGTCVELCEPGALEALPGIDVRKTAGRSARAAWDRIAETSEATKKELSDAGKIGEAAALLLLRKTSLSLWGSDGAEPGSGGRSALRLILAAAENHMRPLLNDHMKTIAVMEKDCAGKIRNTLADALPTGDLDLLAEGIAAAGGKSFDLSSLARRMELACDEGKVDGADLAVLVDHARSLAELRSRMEGGTGLPRAPHGMVIASESVARWAAVYPYNPFSVPVVVDTTTHSAALAEGLALGQVRNTADEVRLIRAARELLGKRGGAGEAREARITWRDWTDDERRLCPPLILVYDDEAFECHGRAHLSRLLHSELPIKVVLLSGLDSGIGGGGMEASGDAGLVALAHRDCFTLQTSIAHPDHLVHGVAHALDYPGPAFIRVHAPSPRRDGFSSERGVEQARLAVWSRAYPLFCSDPARGSEGLPLNLDGNPSTEPGWTVDGSGKPFTYADWAVTEGRFAPHFPALPTDGGGSPAGVAEYFQFAPDKREKLTPCVDSPSADGGESSRLEVSAAMIKAADEHLKAWELLRELGGLSRIAIEAQHQAAVVAAEAATRDEMTARLRERLRTLAGVGAGQPSENGGE